MKSREEVIEYPSRERRWLFERDITQTCLSKTRVNFSHDVIEWRKGLQGFFRTRAHRVINEAHEHKKVHLDWEKKPRSMMQCGVGAMNHQKRLAASRKRRRADYSQRVGARAPSTRRFRTHSSSPGCSARIRSTSTTLSPLCAFVKKSICQSLTPSLSGLINTIRGALQDAKVSRTSKRHHLNGHLPA